MSTFQFPFIASLLALFIGTASLAQADPSAGEKARIDLLISKIENLKDASFIRNGSTYGAASAAKFLRAKLKSNSSSIATADDFITKLASKSSTSGEAYKIKYADGKEIACETFLKAELAKAADKK